MKEKAKIKISTKLSLIITIIGLLVIITGTSYAILRGNSSSLNEQVIKTGDVTLTLTENYESINKKIIVLEDSEGLLQEDVYEFNIKNIGSIAARYDLSIINEVPSSYEGEVIPLEYIKVGLEINGEEYGPFNIGELEGIIDSNIIYRKEIINYKLRVWLDKEYEENIESIEGYKAFLKLKVEAEQFLGNLDKSGANEPVLASSMIPVYFDEEEGVWKKADETNTNYKHKWYDYNEKMWANSVTVSSTTRETYLKAELGTEVKMDDILTMQVWIPRYKYKVWNYNADGLQTSEPQEIEIVFEKDTNTTGDIECTDTISGTDGAKSESCKINNVECTDSTCNNKYYTHPAFTFGEEELEGFWVSKFEISPEESSTCYTSTNNTNCNITGLNIMSKPNVKSYRDASVATYGANIMAMNDEGNIYGLSTDNDTHMIKNMEWGAVAYLSHSKYGTCTSGTCTEIGINNNNEYITGCGASAGSSESATCNSYETELGQNASTTGNIYGVYDMSGGSYEYTMSNIVSPDGTTMMSGRITESGYHSDYTGILHDEGNYTSYIGTYDYPEEKYYDKYSFGSKYNDNIRSKLGDGIKEIAGWNNTVNYVPRDMYPWGNRGGHFDLNNASGIFYSNNASGGWGDTFSTRFIIANKRG